MVLRGFDDLGAQELRLTGSKPGGQIRNQRVEVIALEADLGARSRTAG
jgi:hypothetical protein